MKLEVVFENGRREAFDGVASFYVTDEKTVSEEYCALQFDDVQQIQTKGNLFEVNPWKIDRSKFEEFRDDVKQYAVSREILEAFEEVDKNPKKYASTFYTMVPEKKQGDSEIINNHRDYAEDLGGKMADWVEWRLELAQRISNGESWESICNNVDTSKWYRIIIGENGEDWIVGDSYMDTTLGSKPSSPMSYSKPVNYCSFFQMPQYYAVPLVVFKKK